MPEGWSRQRRERKVARPVVECGGGGGWVVSEMKKEEGRTGSDHVSVSV